MSARAQVLGRIRAALGEYTAPPADVPRMYRTSGEHPNGSPEVCDLFVERVGDYRATVHRTTVAGLPAALAAVLDAAGVRTLVVPPGLPAALLEGTVGTRVLHDEPSAPLGVDTLDAADAVLTACAVAVAETGTFVLDASPDQGRRVLTLVPDHHIVVVRAAQVVHTVPEALARLDPTRPLTWVSGPSATSDIELDRVEGVHGPRTLDVILVLTGSRTFQPVTAPAWGP